MSVHPSHQAGATQDYSATPLNSQEPTFVSNDINVGN